MEILFFTSCLLLSIPITFLFSKYTIGKAIPLPQHGRFIEIDGLRGYLALMVAAHHFYIIYGWLSYGKWVAPDFIVFNNIGVFAVSVFFMITGFLFIGKVDKARENKSFDFHNLIKSRVFRIYPLYFLAVILTVSISLHMTLYKYDNVAGILNDILKWIIFLGDSVNGYHDSKIITAGVTWTLKYEWLFYISLIFIYFISRFKCGLPVLGAVVVLFSFMKVSFLYFNSMYFIFFVIGGVSHFLHKRYSGLLKRESFKGGYSSLALLFSMMLALLTPEKDNLLIFSFSSFVFFITIVMGGDFFGVLRMKTSRALGEISYSIYLMHGVIFFLSFNMLCPDVIKYGFFGYGLLLPISLLVVVVFSTFTYLTIELPMIKAGKRKVNVKKLKNNNEAS